MDKPVSQDPTPLIPYMQRLRKSKLDKQFIKFMEVFNKLHINIPFADALEQMLTYVKFIEEMKVGGTRDYCPDRGMQCHNIEEAAP